MNIKSLLTKLKTDMTGVFSKVLAPEKAMIKMLEVITEQQKQIDDLKDRLDKMEYRSLKIEKKMRN